MFLFLTRLVLILIPASLLSAVQVRAEAFRIIDQSASATAQGGAFAAQSDDASALHYNPAGMTQLRGVQFSIGTNLIGGDTTFTDSTGMDTTGDFNGSIADPPPSNFYLTANLEDLGLQELAGLTVGIGVTSPFGILIDYPENSNVAQLSSFAALPLIDIKPTLAFKVDEYISLGVGLDINTFASFLGEGQAELKRIAGPEFGIPPPGGVGFLGITPGSSLEINGTDTALGFNLSLLVTPWRNPDEKPRLNLALVYRSSTTLELDGDLLVNGQRFADARTKVHLPTILTGGVAIWPIRDKDREWKMEVDVDYADWTSFTDLDVELSNISIPPSLITQFTFPQPRDWNDTFVVMVGTESKWLHPRSLPDWEVAARAGYVYSETPVPESTFEPTVPDSDSHSISVGMGFLCGEQGAFFGFLPCGILSAKAIGLDLAYQLVLFESRTINNNIDPRVIGKWGTTIHVGAINLRMNF